MPNQINKGYSFVDGNVVDAAALNQLVDDATAQVGIVMEQAPISPSPLADSDFVLIQQNSSGTLKRASVAAFPNGVTSVGISMPPGTFNVTGSPVTGAGTLGVSFESQAPNTVLAGAATGSTFIEPVFRGLEIKDYTKPTVTIAALAVDWSLGTVFNKSLVANSTFTFTNPSDGQTIKIRLFQNASWAVTWPSGIRWPDGIAPIMTPGAGRFDIYTFMYIGGIYFGTFAQNFIT